MKKKIKKLRRQFFPCKPGTVPPVLTLLSAFLCVLFLSGCAKTSFPEPPVIASPAPPKLVSVVKTGSGMRLIYSFEGNTGNIRGFLIYLSYFGSKKDVKYSCDGLKPAAYQNLAFKKIFSLHYGKFFYNVNMKNVKPGYYLFCARTVGVYGTKSQFSKYIIASILSPSRR